MKKMISLLVFLSVTLATTNVFAHAGHIHTYMGTVTTVHTDTQFMMKTADGKDLTIDTTPKTSWLDAQGHAAKKNDLAVGARVVVKMNIDGKTAASVTMAPQPKVQAH
jgi:hypothetical protein